jgi:hypothetical protein
MVELLSLYMRRGGVLGMTLNCSLPRGVKHCSPVPAGDYKLR